jgi:hypothetical protein
VVVASVVDVRLGFTQVGKRRVDYVGDARLTPDDGRSVRRITAKLLLGEQKYIDKHRRRVLALLGTAGVTTLAGCGSDDDRETGTPTPLTGKTKLTAEDGNGGDRLGYSVGVSSDGTTAVIGAPFDDNPNGEDVPSDETRTVIGSPGDGGLYGPNAGSAYVFQLEDGAWREEAKLVSEDGDNGDQFGFSVGVSGDATTAVIGARNDDNPNRNEVGSAYVFQREGNEWREERKLAPEDDNEGNEFGSSIGMSGDGTTAVIGADRDDNPNGKGAGSAYVFQREGEEWHEERKLTPEDGDLEDRFGSSVGVSSDGGTAVIGARNDDDPNGTTNQPLGGAGSAYVFTREDGAWREEQKLAPVDGDEDDGFGISVGVSGGGTTAVIGAVGDEDPNGEFGGSVYVFQRGDSAWSEEAKLTPEDGDERDGFGYSVGMSSDGTTAVIGAAGDEDPNGHDGGSAYVFQLEDGAWSEAEKLAAEDGDSGDEFGFSVGVSGDGATAVIGADRDEDPNGEDESGNGAGSAYVFQLGE